MILGFVGLLTAQAAAALAAAALSRRVPASRAEERFLVFLLLRAAIVSCAVLLTGFAGLLRPLPLSLGGAALLAGLLFAGEHRKIPWRIRRPDGIPFLLWIAPWFFLARALLQVLAFSPFDGDVLSYHLPPMAEWIRSGRIPGEVGNDPRSWFPAGFQLLEASWVVFLRHDVAIEMAGIEFLVVLFVAALCLARSLGLDGAPAWFAAMLSAGTPAAVMQSFSCLNDLPAAALVVSGAALLQARAPWALLVLLAGLAAGLKPTALYAGPGLALLAWLRREPTPRPAVPAGIAGGFLMAGLLLGSTWYVRNLVVHGNPVFPIGSSAGVEAFGEDIQQVGGRLESLGRNLGQLADERIRDGRRPYHPMLPYGAGWGLGIIALGLPALVWALQERPSLRPVALAFGLSLISVLALVKADIYNGRFALFFPVLPALAAGFLLEKAPSFRWVALSCFAVNFLTTMVPFAPDWPELRDKHLSLDWRDRGQGNEFDPIPAPPRVGVWGRALTVSYAFYRPDFSVEVVHLRARTAEEIAPEARARGVRVLYLHEHTPIPAERQAMDEAVRLGGLRRLSPSSYEVMPP